MITHRDYLTDLDSRRFDLDWVLAPIESEVFWSTYWEQRPLVIRRGDSDYYRDLLSLANVDDILMASTIREDDIRIVKRGRHTPVHELRIAALPGSSNQLERLYQAYREGATVVIQGLHERWRPLGLLCQNIARAFSGGAQVNLYLTPPGENGLPPHYDTHDVFVLQSSGSKHWRIFDRPVEAPGRDQPYERISDPGEPKQEFDLEAGDLLYLPRGFIHVAEARDETSLHLTLGLHPVTVAAVVRSMAERVIRKDPRLRKALAPGFARDAQAFERSVSQLREALDVLSEFTDAEAEIVEARKWAMASEPPDLSGHLLDLAALPGLTLKTRLRLRPNLSCQIEEGDESVSITFNCKRVTVPRYAGACIDHMLAGEAFAIGGLPDALDRKGKLALAERLLREGFLTAA